MEEEQLALKALQKIPNIGPAIAQMLIELGIYSVEELAGEEPNELYDAISVLRGTRMDICLLDAFAAAIDYAKGLPARPWWEYSRERKAKLKEIIESGPIVDSDDKQLDSK